MLRQFDFLQLSPLEQLRVGFWSSHVPFLIAMPVSVTTPENLVGREAGSQEEVGESIIGIT